jgi:hypothetical protein
MVRIALRSKQIFWPWTKLAIDIANVRFAAIRAEDKVSVFECPADLIEEGLGTNKAPHF